MDKNGTSDPYVTLNSSFNKQRFKTKVVKKTLTPKWGQTFAFITSKAEGMLFLKVWDKDLFSKDEFMGEVTLNLSQFADGQEYEQWFKFESEPVKKKLTNEPGEMKLKIWFTGPEPFPKKKKADKEPSPIQPSPSKSDKDKPKDDKPKKEPKAEPPKDSAPKESPRDKEAPKEAPKDKNADKKDKKEKKSTNIEDNYEFGKVLGRGAFSVVKQGIRKASGKKYAIKCITKKLLDKKELSLLEREIDIMKKLQHPHIIQLMEVVDTPETLFLVLEYASGGELFDAIVNKGSYSEADAAKIISQILEAIKYVHDHGIAHRDLKPENLLLLGPEEGKGDFIKIADFGLSKDFGEEQLQTSCGTPDYVAPEVLLGEPYDKEVDVWSIGVIGYVLLCGFPPFYGETQKELFENIMNGQYDFPDPEWTEVSAGAKAFIKKMLVVNPEKRYTAEEALADPWLREYAAKKDFKRVETFSVNKFKEYTKKYKEQNPSGADKP